MSASLDDLVDELHARLVRRMDLRRNEIERLDEGAFRAEARAHLQALLSTVTLPAGLDTGTLERRVLQDCVGLGPLEDLLDDEAVTEIMVNGHQEMFAERGGRLWRVPRSFRSEHALRVVIERLLGPTGRRVDEASPMVDARLRDGSRLNVILPPLSVHGPCVTIRKFGRHRMTLDDLVVGGTLSKDMAGLLHQAMQLRLNVVISGGTATGKTTLLNALARLIPPEQRVITIEDAAELRLERTNLVSLEARPRNVEGAGQVEIRDLLRNALRMRPDRIVIGECRGGEALDMLQAMNTGHNGSLTSVHANSPRDALSRLEVMVLMAGLDLPLSAIRSQIASSVDLVVQIERFSCGTRRVVEIAEVTGMEQGVVQTQRLFHFRRTGRTDDGRVQGAFESSPLPPAFLEEHCP